MHWAQKERLNACIDSLKSRKIPAFSPERVCQFLHWPIENRISNRVYKQMQAFAILPIASAFVIEIKANRNEDKKNIICN